MAQSGWWVSSGSTPYQFCCARIGSHIAARVEESPQRAHEQQEGSCKGTSGRQTAGVHQPRSAPLPTIHGERDFS
ncbi:hypothetical protein NDU88_007702 [Pleurodeles waltl]|uniref:Uncharacterized protein n=1 Tax=Pleurodeles waltl TaxID=8319 RepID=A0AAV7RVI7_PLEWA|nr:hypothetical protein NDU88_007702 [Pleurodeles waltl]